MKLRTRCAALSVAALIGIAAAPAAGAVDVEPPASKTHTLAYDEQMFTDDGNSGARVRFTANGDVVELCDIQADGYAAYLKVWNNDAALDQYTYRIGGDGRCQTFRASLGGIYDFAEGHLHGFRIALVKSGSSKLHWADTAYWVA